MSVMSVMSAARSIRDISIGTYGLSPEEAYEAVSLAIERGFRKFDTASIYGTEEAVGRAIRNSQLPRSEFHVTTKLSPRKHGKDKTVEAVRASLANLQMEYVDVIMLHRPHAWVKTSKQKRRHSPKRPRNVDHLVAEEIEGGWIVLSDPELSSSDSPRDVKENAPNATGTTLPGSSLPGSSLSGSSLPGSTLPHMFVETYESLEECVELGLARDIGLSNMTIEQLQAFAEWTHRRQHNRVGRIECIPVVCQLEFHPFGQQSSELKQFLSQRDVVLQAYSPLCSHQRDLLFICSPILKIAEKHKVSVGTCILSWLLHHHRVSVVVRANTEEYLNDALVATTVFLDDVDCQTINQLNRNMFLFHQTE